MNFRTTAILFGIVLAFGVILLVLNLTTEDATPTDAIVEELAGAGLKADDVQSIVLERPQAGQTLKIARIGKDSWKIEEPITARADASAVDSVVRALFTARPKEYGDLSGNAASHGLSPPGLKVTLNADGKSSTVNVGDLTFGSNAVAFVTTSKRSRPMAIPASDLSALFRDTRGGGKAGELAKWTNDYRSKQIFSVEDRAGTGFENVAAIKVSLPNKKQEVAVSRSEDLWKFDAPAGWGEAAVTGPPSTTKPNAINGVREMINAVLNLQALSADDFIDQPKDLKQYGLNRDNPDIIRVELKPKDRPAEVVWIGKKEGPPAKKDSTSPPPPTPSQVYVQVEGSPTVIRANASEKLDGLAAVAADPSPLRERDLLRAENRERIDAIDITFAGMTTKLRKTGTNEWKLYGTPKDPTSARETVVAGLLDLLYQPDLIKDFPAPNDANFAGPETKVEIKLWADGVESGGDAKAEPKLKGNPTVLQFGKKDAAGVHVRRTLPNGTKNDFVLPESVKTGASPDPTDLMAAVTKGRLEFFEAPLESFSAFQANKLTITQGGKTTEVLKDPSAVPNFPSGRWTFTQPPEMKGIVADADLIRGDLLNFLASQQPERYVAEAATDDQLKAWQLHDSNPRMRVTVGIDTGPEPKDPKAKDDKAKKDQERVYWFGTDTADGKSVHVRQGDSKVVFTVPKSLFDKFANADLRDKALVRFDPSKVERLKVRGWTEATGQMLVREFKREGGTWVALEPKGYNVDPAKVEQFLRDVLALRAKSFRSGPEHPDHRFLPEQSGFEITLDLVPGQEDMIVNIAAEVDNKASRIAKVEFLTMPPRSVLVTVPPDALKSYRDNPAAFAK